MQTIQNNRNSMIEKLACEIQKKLNEASFNQLQLTPAQFRGFSDKEAWQVIIPIGPDLTVPIRSMHRLDQINKEEDFSDEVRTFSTAIINVLKEADELKSYIIEVSISTNNAIATRQSMGDKIELVGVTLKPTLAMNLDSESSERAAGFILAVVSVAYGDKKVLDEFYVEQPEDVYSELDDFVDDLAEMQ